MSTFWILLEQMELFVIYILAGVILVKSRLFNRETLQPISKFVLRMGLSIADLYEYYQWGRAKCSAEFRFCSDVSIFCFMLPCFLSVWGSHGYFT